MLATLVPLFDENLSVMAYSLFSQKANYLTDPIFSVSAQFDGAGSIDGLEILESIGVSTLSDGKVIFIPVNNPFMNWHVQYGADQAFGLFPSNI